MSISLKYRIAIIIFVLEAVMMGVVLWQTLRHSGNATQMQLANTDSVVLEIVSGIGRVALLTEEYADLQPYLEDLLDTARIEQALLIDARGLVVASSNPSNVGRAPPGDFAPSPQAAFDAGNSFWRSQEIRNSAGLLGVLAIQISNEALLEATAEARNLGIAIAVTGMAIIAVVGLAVGIILTSRLAAVTATANRFAEGQLEARTGITGQDEVGELGQTFDKMADRLERVQAEERALIDQLSRKNAQLERFAYTVSHDLKTPLVTVRGFAGMLEKDLAKGNLDGARNDLQYILSGTSTMANLLEDLLKLSRVGLTVNEMEIVSLNTPFEKAMQDLQSLATEQNAEIDIQSGMPDVFVDPNRMYEVAINLLQNALKFSRGGQPVRIKVRARELVDTIECSVEDNGIGIDPQYHEQIFGLFNRLDQSYEGTGIGLSLVKTIVEAHSGSVEVSSRGEGQGARFTITLPLPPVEKRDARAIDCEASKKPMPA